MDGKYHRFKVNGDKSSKKSGWYKFYNDNLPAGRFGTWRGDVWTNWHAAPPNREMSEDDWAAVRAAQARARLEHDAEAERLHKAAAETAAKIWAETTAADPAHGYLARKQVKPHGLHQTTDGRLVMAVYVGDTISSLQYIDKDGGKIFHSGGTTAGGYYAIPAVDQRGKPIYIVEGFATGASVAEATGAAVIVALNAGNLPKVAKWAHDKQPLMDYVVVADNDESGVGEKRAREAAELCNGRVVMPPNVGQDANDYAVAGNDLAALLTEHKPWLIHGKDFYTQPAPLKWLIKDWVQENALMMCFGASGCGKTFFTLDLSLAIASYLDEWHGHKVRGGPVVYLAGEGQYGMRARVAAWVHEHGDVEPDIYVSNSACDLNTDTGYKQVVNEIRRYNTRPVLIVVDTLNRFLLGDENKADDARTMIDRCGKLMLEFGCTVLLVHHTGVNPDNKDRARGSSAWRGAMDIEIKVEWKDHQMVVSQTKSKDAEIAQKMCFGRYQITIPGWKDEDGGAVTSCVLKPEERKHESKALGKNQQRGLDAYEKAAREKGHVSKENDKDVYAGLDLDDWRDVFCAMRKDNGEDSTSNRQLFKRAREDLIDRGEIKIRNGRAFLSGDASGIRENEILKVLLAAKTPTK